jgi:hypothetical protein
MNESVDNEGPNTGFERRSAALLRESAANLDGRTRSRLNRARQAALDELPAARRPGVSGYRWAAAGVAAVAVLAAVLLSNRPGEPLQSPVPLAEVSAAAVDLDLLMAEEELEMLEDLEFFAWLESEDFAGIDGAAG